MDRLLCHCGKSYKETIKAIGHNYSQVTCTAASVCANCNHTKQAALGHEDNGKTRCSRCNANLTTELSVVLEGETSYMLYESFKWKPAGDAYYRMTVKVLEIMPTDNTTLDVMFHVEYDNCEIKKENVKAGDVFTLDFYVYNHTAQYHDRITWRAQSCIIEVTIEIL